MFREIINLIFFFVYYITNKKFLLLNVERIGHLSINSLSAIENLKKIKKKNIILIFRSNLIRKNICNIFLLNLFKEKMSDYKLNFVESDIAVSIMYRIFNKPVVKNYDSNEVINFKKIHKYYSTTKNRFISVIHSLNDIGAFFDKENMEKKKYFNSVIINRSKNLFFLKEKKFVCFHSRDNSYMNYLYTNKNYLYRNKNKNFNYHNYRNSNYLKLVKSADYLTKKKNLIIIRMGNYKDKIVGEKKIFGKKHLNINFNNNKNQDQIDDVIACSNCLFYLGDTSGLAIVPTLFNVPVARYNFIPIFNSQPFKGIMLPSLIMNKKNKKYLKFRDVYKIFNKSELSMNVSENYKKLGLKVIHNNENDILHLVKEIYQRSIINEFEIDDKNQIKFNYLMQDLGFYNFGLVGKKFFKKYQDLFV